MKKLLCILFFLYTVIGNGNAYAQNEFVGTVEVSNRSGMFIRQQLLVLDWQKFSASFGISDTAVFSIHYNDRELPLQLETGGSGTIRNLLVMTEELPKGKTVFKVMKGPRKAVRAMTFGRFVPERKDDFAWENDLVGFRMYGKALESTNENAHGIDVWVKRSSELVVNERYRRNDYHEDHGDGLDYYSVGNTLGAGNLAPFWNDSIWYPGNFSGWKILDQGPLRLRFRLSYDTIMLGSRKFSMSKTITLDAHRFLNSITVDVFTAGEAETPVVIGVVQRKEPGQYLFNDHKGSLSYWEPAHPRNGTTGVAVVAGKGSGFSVQYGQFLLKRKVKNGEPFTYLAGACWDKQGMIGSVEQWDKRVAEEAAQQEAMRRVRVKYVITSKQP